MTLNPIEVRRDDENADGVENTVVQIQLDGKWVDYSRTTEYAARMFCLANKNYRAVDWIDKRWLVGDQ